MIAEIGWEFDDEEVQSSRGNKAVGLQAFIEIRRQLKAETDARASALEKNLHEQRKERGVAVEHTVLVDALEEMAAIEDANMEKDATITELRQELEQTISDKDAERADALSTMQQFMDEDKYETSQVMQQQIDGQLGILLESINKVGNKSAAGVDETKSEVINFLRKSNNEKADSIVQLQKLVADLEAAIKAGEQHQRDMFERGWTAARVEQSKGPAPEQSEPQGSDAISTNDQMLQEMTAKDGEEAQRQILTLEEKLARAEETLANALAREQELEDALAEAVLTSQKPTGELEHQKPPTEEAQPQLELSQPETSVERAARLIFERFDNDGDGFHSLKETEALALVLHDVRVSKSDFIALCEDLGADDEKGISINEFKLIYTDPSFEADAEADYRRVFGAALR
jgi:hypothetical protein